jgi:hypothetical protein
MRLQGKRVPAVRLANAPCAAGTQLDDSWTVWRDHTGLSRRSPKRVKCAKVLHNHKREQSRACRNRPVTPESFVGVRRGCIQREALEGQGGTFLSRSPGCPSVARHTASYAGRCPSVPLQRVCRIAPLFLHTDGSQDGCEGQRGHFRDILWSGQRRESIEMKNNEP